MLRHDPRSRRSCCQGEPIAGVGALQGRHVDGFEAWLAERGLTRIHLYTLLVKVVAVLRQIAVDSPNEISPDLRDRPRYVSAKPFQRSRPRDAYSPYVARQLRTALVVRHPRRRTCACCRAAATRVQPR